ncbi:unnamed protein product, partial [Meganyctiphanes norvegica]
MAPHCCNNGKFTRTCFFVDHIVSVIIDAMSKSSSVFIVLDIGLKSVKAAGAIYDEWAHCLFSEIFMVVTGKCFSIIFHVYETEMVTISNNCLQVTHKSFTDGRKHDIIVVSETLNICEEEHRKEVFKDNLRSFVFISNGAEKMIASLSIIIEHFQIMGGGCRFEMIAGESIICVDNLGSEISLLTAWERVTGKFLLGAIEHGVRLRGGREETVENPRRLFPLLDFCFLGMREVNCHLRSNHKKHSENELNTAVSILIFCPAYASKWHKHFTKMILSPGSPDGQSMLQQQRRRRVGSKEDGEVAEYGVSFVGDHEMKGQGNSMEMHVQDINVDHEKQDFEEEIFKREYGKRIVKEKYSKEGDYIVNHPRQQYYRLNPQKCMLMSEPFSCSECGEIFESEPLYKIHCVEVHTEHNGFRCQHCPLIFDKRHEFDSHLINHTPINHVCETCSVGFPSAALLIKHLQDIHPNTANTCTKCKATFIDKDQLVYHMDQKHRRGRRKKDEKVVDLPGNSVVCSECGKVCSTMMAYQSHKYNEHIHLYPHECRVCCRRFSRLEYLDTHLKTHINGNIVCQKCSVKFSNASHLVDHMYYVHGQKKALMCAICQRFFSSPSSLKIHQNMEHRDGLICKEICQVCGEKYPTTFTLKRHMMTHKREHQCNYCGKNMSTKASLEVHINMIHTKEQSYLCPHCQREFFVKHLLQMHVKRVHSDRRDFQFKCNICNKSYLQEWELVLHNKTHTNERNFKCDVCGEAFYTISRMRYHRATHKTTRDSECPVCNQMFRRDVDTKNHLRRVHKVINPGHFIELCARFGKDKAQELHQMEVIGEQESGLIDKESRVIVEDVLVDKDSLEMGESSNEHITLYRMEEETEEQPVQVIIPDSMEMMVLEEAVIAPQNSNNPPIKQSQSNLSHEDVTYVYVNDSDKQDDSIKGEQQIISIIQIDDFPD